MPKIGSLAWPPTSFGKSGGRKVVSSATNVEAERLRVKVRLPTLPFTRFLNGNGDKPFKLKPSTGD